MAASVESLVNTIRKSLPKPEPATAHAYGSANAESLQNLSAACQDIRMILESWQNTTAGLDEKNRKRLLTHIKDRGVGEKASSTVLDLVKFMRNEASEHWDELDKSTQRTDRRFLLQRLKAAVASIQHLNVYPLSITVQSTMNQKITLSHPSLMIDITVGPFPLHEPKLAIVAITGEENPELFNLVSNLVLRAVEESDYQRLRDIVVTLIERSSTIQRVNSLISKPPYVNDQSALELYRALRMQIEQLYANDSSGGDYIRCLNELHGILKPVIAGIGVGFTFYVPPNKYDIYSDIVNVVQAGLKEEYSVSFKLRTQFKPSPVIGANGVSLPIQFIMELTPPVVVPRYYMNKIHHIAKGNQGEMPVVDYPVGGSVQPLLAKSTNNIISLDGITRRYATGAPLPNGVLINQIPFKSSDEILPLTKILRQCAVWSQLYKSCFDGEVTEMDNNAVGNSDVIELGGTGGTSFSVTLLPVMVTIEVNVEENGVINVKCPEGSPFKNSGADDFTQLLSSCHSIPKMIHHFLARE